MKKILTHLRTGGFRSSPICSYWRCYVWSETDSNCLDFLFVDKFWKFPGHILFKVFNIKKKNITPWLLPDFSTITESTGVRSISFGCFGYWTISEKCLVAEIFEKTILIFLPFIDFQCIFPHFQILMSKMLWITIFLKKSLLHFLEHITKCPGIRKNMSPILAHIMLPNWINNKILL